MSAGESIGEAALVQRAGRRVQLGRWLVATTLGLVLLALTLYGVNVVAQPGVSGNPTLAAILWINTLIMVAALVLELRRRPYSLHLMHLLALFLFMGASALFQVSAGRFAVAGPIETLRKELLPAAIVVSLWIVSYLSAYELHQNLARPIPHDAIGRFFDRGVSAQRVLVLHFFAIGVLTYLGVIGLLGLATRGAAEEALLDNASIAAGVSGFALALKVINQYVLRGLPLIVMIAGFLVYRHAAGPVRNLLRLMLPVLVAGNLAANNPFAASRMWLVTVLFGVLSPFVFRRARTGLPVVLVTLAGLALLPALHESRLAYTFEEWFRFAQIRSPIEYLATSADGDHLGMVSLAVRWVGEHGHTFGNQMAGAIVFWVPRRFWPDKPIGTGSMVTGDLGFGFTNWSMPIVAEGFVDFSYFGVILLAVVFGWVLSRGDRSYWHRREGSKEPRVIDVLYPLWLGCVVFFTRGDLIAAAGQTSPFVFWALALGVGGWATRPGSSARSGVAGRSSRGAE